MPEGNLLTEPVFGVRLPDGQRARWSLPQVLAQLGAGEIEAFTGLRPHQEHAWHAFLVQLAAIAFHRSGEGDPAPSAERWTAMLRALTGGEDEPWCLVVEDLAKPAFMQPPVPEGTLAVFKEPRRQPDQIDVLVTAKNHDVKGARMRSPSPEDWVFALVSLQTMQGFLGAGNYGIARMNSGFASRPAVSLSPSTAFAARFRRDLGVLRSGRAEIAQNHGYAMDEGVTLLWLPPWNGTSALPISALDPYFIEVCRRVRLEGLVSQLASRAAPTIVARVAAKELKGVTGDPWTPIDAIDLKALTVSGGGFHYRLIQELLFSGDYRPGKALEFSSADGGGALLIASVLVRGQGVTEGLHRRIVPIPKVRMSLFSQPSERERIGLLAKAHVEDASEMQGRVLKPALLVLLQGAPDKLDFKDARAERFTSVFDAGVDDCFFEALWADADLTPEAAAVSWGKRLLALAEAQLRLAEQSVPIPVTHRYRAIAASERALFGGARRAFPHLFPKPEEATTDAA
jgi:CRISPR system Cascade subunit CasA